MYPLQSIHPLRLRLPFRDGLPAAHLGGYGPAQILVSLVERPHASAPRCALKVAQAVLQTFTQLGQTGEDAPGVDLGLAVCHKIITAHGGRIYTTNAPEGGVVFHITLPHAGQRIPEPAAPQWTESP